MFISTREDTVRVPNPYYSPYSPGSPGNRGIEPECITETRTTVQIFMTELVLLYKSL